MSKLYTGGELVVKIMEEFGAKACLVSREGRHCT